jgi:HEAT repeat protein
MTWLQVRDSEGIPPLVNLLQAMDLKVQRAAAGALRTLAFKCEENKAQVGQAC